MLKMKYNGLLSGYQQIQFYNCQRYRNKIWVKFVMRYYLSTKHAVICYFHPAII